MLLDLDSGSSTTHYQYHKTYKRLFVANRIREELERLGITNSRFAEMMGKKASETSKWLSGKHNMQLDTLFEIESVLKVELFQYTSETEVKVELPVLRIDIPGGPVKELPYLKEYRVTSAIHESGHRISYQFRTQPGINNDKKIKGKRGRKPRQLTEGDLPQAV